MDHGERLGALRAQMSNVCSMFALGMVMFDLTEESEILRLAVSSVGALGPYHAQDPYLVDDAGMHSSDGDDRLTAELIKLDGVDGAVEVPGVEWSWAFPMRAVSGHTGYLVVSADHEPSIDQRFLLTTLAQLTGAALVSAGLHRRDRTSTAELGDLNARLESTNGQLAAAVTDLQQRQRIHEVLTRVAASGGGAAGIADAVYDLTGLAVAVEDRFGNLLAWAGPGRPRTYPRPQTFQCSELKLFDGAFGFPKIFCDLPNRFFFYETFEDDGALIARQPIDKLEQGDTTFDIRPMRVVEIVGCRVDSFS